MKNLKCQFLLIFFLSFLCSCAPKIVTNVLKSYSPVAETEEVVIYDRENDDQVPESAETIGNIAVVDNGFSVGGTYERVIDMASDETRKHGGNGLLITDHLTPSIWGSSIHQIAGIMLKIDPNDTTLVSSKTVYSSIKENNERNRINNPRHIFAVNFGYGGLARGKSVGSAESTKANNLLYNGFSWDAHYYYHHNGFPYAFGIMASQYYSNPFQESIYQDNKNNLRFDYVALSLGLRRAFPSKWMWNLNFGMGYLGFVQKASDISNPSNFGTRTGNTLGMHIGTGFDYRLSEHFGIGMDFSTISGYFTKVKDKNFVADPSMPEINYENRLNGSRVNVTLGIRYYIQ